jgi:hypothetical protein
VYHAMTTYGVHAFLNSAFGAGVWSDPFGRFISSEDASGTLHV